MSLPGLDSLSPAVLPPAIRDGSKEQRDAYVAALGFERQLLTQLTEQLSKTTSLSEKGESAATKALRDQLPSTLADAVIEAGGLGLAAEIAAQIAARTDPPTTPAPDGTSAT